ncbi:peptidoglycan-binding protein [Nostoc calcicola FACHB-389]|nr:peptidoglycan-binding protein [Nostoc calcicola FACHB-3891]OKH41663.1 peptidoglycan-binding protein [Nostoc calcicola FACHB-389]
MGEHPHGVWIWNLPALSSNYLNRLIECKVKRVYLKVFDGKSRVMFWGKNPTFGGEQCTLEVIKQFKDKDIQVYGWGYHYGTPNIDDQIDAVKQALECGLDGYVLDVEEEVKAASTHNDVKKLLVGLRPLVPAGTLGYTSFGHPGFHPEVPWTILDDFCDIALPQIYFEKFGFKDTNEEEVQECLKAHKTKGLTKPILPIWGSETDSKNPASASELQSYLNRFPGSSIYRLPELRNGTLERSQAWNLIYSDRPLVNTGGSEPADFDLPPLTRVLRQGTKGKDVEALQKALNALGFNVGDIDGDFGIVTENAVRDFQVKAGITVDGEVYTQTWKELSNSFDDNIVVIAPENPRIKLANFAENEAAKQLQWKGGSSEAEKYLKTFRKPMFDIVDEQGNRQISTLNPVIYDWCAAFVHFCCRETGIDVPIQPQGFWATMALVESWKFWAKKNRYWNPKGSIVPQRGDILVFDWQRNNSQLDHIGLVRGYTPGDSTIQTSEGNRGNRSGNFTRELADVAGFIRIV